MLRAPDQSLIGRTIAGKFAIESVIGGGAMGAVFRARQIALDKAIAIKVMHRDISRDPTYVARFLREAKAASRIDHPNSVRVIDFGEESDGLLYLAMELLEGQDLFTLLREESPLAPTRVGDIILQVLAAVAVAHETGVVHRDIKPENIMIQRGTDDEGRPRDHVKVCDFGVAKITDRRGEKADVVTGPAITTEGLVVGTPEYMSPEQGRGEPLDARSDLYSVGVILYQMLAGRVPFDAESALGIVLKHVTEDPVPPTHLRAEVDPKLEAVCLRALQKKREARYQTAREMCAELRNALEGGAGAPGARTGTLEQASLGPAGASRTIIGVGDRKPDGPVATADTAVAFDSSAIRALQEANATNEAPPESSRVLAPAGVPRTRWTGIVLGALLLVIPLGVIAMQFRTAAKTNGTPTVSAPIASTPPPVVSIAPTPLPTHESATPPEKSATPERARTPTMGKQPSATPRASASHGPENIPAVAAGKPVPSGSTAGSAHPPGKERFDPKLAKVSVVNVRAIGVPPEAVRKEVPDAKLERCYRAALTGAGPKPQPSQMTLHLDANEEGKVQGATLNGSPPIPKEAGNCVIKSMVGKQISSEGANLVTADVDLKFFVD